MESASRSAAEVSNIQTAIYATTFVAKQYFRQGDAAGAASLMHQAQQRAKASPEATNNFIFSHLIREYVEMDLADDAIAYAETLPGPTARDSGLRDVAAAAALHGDLSLALAVVDDRLASHGSRRGCWPLAMAAQEVGTWRTCRRSPQSWAMLPIATVSMPGWCRHSSKRIGSRRQPKSLDRIESATVQDVARSRILAGQAKAQNVAELRATLAGLQSREEQLVASKTLVASSHRG